MKKILAAAVLTLGASGCLGPNNMFDSLNIWNAEVVEQDWLVEVIFIGMYIIPVYPIALLGDVIVINTVDYWSGENPIDDPGPFPNEAFAR